MSTLKRESNPTGGYAPAILPQHQKTDGTYVETGENNALPVKTQESAIIQPIETQSRYVLDIQTHAGANALPSQQNISAWQDSHVGGTPLTFLALSVNMTSGTGMTIEIQFSHDGVNFFSGPPTKIYDGGSATYGSTNDIHLPARFFRIIITNKDATNPKVTNAYARLKA